MNTPGIFKECSRCNAKWSSREEFLADTGISMVGYQPHFEDLQAGLFLFNHSCGTTLSLPVVLFKDLHKGKIFEESKRGSADCPGYCLNKFNLRPCPAECECAYVREIIQIIAKRRGVILSADSCGSR